MTGPHRRVDAGHDEVAGRYGLPALPAMIGGVIGSYNWLVGLMGYVTTPPLPPAVVSGQVPARLAAPVLLLYRDLLDGIAIVPVLGLLLILLLPPRQEKMAFKSHEGKIDVTKLA